MQAFLILNSTITKSSFAQDLSYAIIQGGLNKACYTAHIANWLYNQSISGYINIKMITKGARTLAKALLKRVQLEAF